MTAKRLSEITILSRDLDTAADAWAHTSNLSTAFDPGEGRIDVGDVALRLLAPEKDAETAALIEQRGEGLFGLTIDVDDLASTVAGLRAREVKVSDITSGEDGRLEARIEPADSHGVPIRLVEKR